MEMSTANWDACGSNDPDGIKGPKITIGFFKKVDGISFSKDQWEAFKELGDDFFEFLES